MPSNFVIDHIVKIGVGDAQHAAQVVQKTRAYAIRAAFIFLNMLECRSNTITKFFLAEAEQRPAKAHPDLNTYDDGLGFFKAGHAV